MYNRTYQRHRGELQALGDILHAALKVADPNYYRPERPFHHAQKKKRGEDDGKLRGVQLELFAPPVVQQSTLITPENPITDADVPF